MVIYSGNKKKTGGLLKVSHAIEKNKAGRSEISFFFTIQQQTGYDEKKHLATFKDGKVKTVKFNQMEIGSIVATYLSSISGGKIDKWTSFHDGKDKTSISFSHYYVASPDPKNKPDTNMFTLSFKVGDEKFGVGITFGDMYILKTKIDVALSEFALIEQDEMQKERIKFTGNNTSTNSEEEDSNSENSSNDDDEEDDDVPF